MMRKIKTRVSEGLKRGLMEIKEGLFWLPHPQVRLSVQQQDAQHTAVGMGHKLIASIISGRTEREHPIWKVARP
jgi:hypothetical protein